MADLGRHGGAVLLTVSRTSLFALLAATLWALVGPRLGRWASVAAVAVAWPVYQLLVGAARDNGFFAERAGSDALRLRLAVIEGIMADDAGLKGMGLGTAKAVVDGAPLWFHNSYSALRVEGGVIAFGLLVVCLAALFWSIHQVPADRRNAWYESAVLAGLICSLNIGFSLTSVSMAVAVGMYVLYWRQSVGATDGDGDEGADVATRAAGDPPAPRALTRLPGRPSPRSPRTGRARTVRGPSRPVATACASATSGARRTRTHAAAKVAGILGEAGEPLRPRDALGADGGRDDGDVRDDRLDGLELHPRADPHRNDDEPGTAGTRPRGPRRSRWPPRPAPR